MSCFQKDVYCPYVDYQFHNQLNHFTYLNSISALDFMSFTQFTPAIVVDQRWSSLEIVPNFSSLSLYLASYCCFLSWDSTQVIESCLATDLL